MSDHALLSPSGAKRYLTCTASPSACEGLPERETEYSKAGTDADRLLMAAIDNATPPRTLEPGHKDIVAVSKAYEYLETYIQDSECEVYTQLRVAPPADKYGDYIHENLAGTLDIAVVNATQEWLSVIDYKNGFQIVEPTDPQMLIYSIGLLAEFSWMGDFNTIIRGVIQPNSPHEQGPIRIIQHKIEEVIAEFEERVVPKVMNIQQGIVEFMPSEDACRFCDRKFAPGGCKALNDAGVAAAGSYFNDETQALVIPHKDDVLSWTPEQIAAALEGKKLFDLFWKTINTVAEETLLRGEEIPGWKMVEGRLSNRDWAFETDEELEQFLTKELKMKKGEIYTQKLLSVAQAEKMIDPNKRGGKKKLELLKERIAERKPGKPQIVHESNPKPALGPMFENEEEVDPLS